MVTRGLLGSTLVLVGGVVGATLPRSTPVLRWQLLDAVRASEAGRMLALAVVLTGLGLLAASWLALCRHVALARGADAEDALELVRHASVVWSAPLVLAPPLFSRDGWSYAAQGMLTHLGISPYVHGPAVLHGPVVQAVDPMWLETPTPYGPVPLAAGAAMAAHTGNPWVLVVGHRALALLGVALLAWAVPRLAERTGARPALATALVVASPLMLANGVAGLHNDVLMAGLAAVALEVGLARGWVPGVLLGATAAGVKAPGGLVCLAVVLASLPVLAGARERLTRLGLAGVLALAWLWVLGLLVGVGTGWVQGLSVPAVVNTPLSVTTLLGGTLDWGAHLLGADLAPATFLGWVRGAGSLATLGVLGWAALRRPTGDAAAAVGTTALVLGTTVALSPVVHLWYLLWVTPFLALLPLPRLGASALVGVSVIAGLVAPMDSSLHGAYYAIVLGCMMLAVLAPLLLWTPRARARVERIVHGRAPTVLVLPDEPGLRAA